jgi:probable F420-dependent oxidoreductase
MDIGVLLLFDGSPGSTLRECAETARALEAAGFSELWHGDHVVFFESYAPNYPYSPDGHPPFGERQGIYNPLIVLAAAASATSTIRLGVSVMILPQRNPLILAQEAASLDHLSNGRLDLGVGVGWAPEEFDALRVPFERRGARTNEYIEAMTSLWQDDLSTYKGEFASFDKVVCLPKPIQKPRIPVIVGGQSPAALRRAARLGDGWISWMLPIRDVPSTLDDLRIECEKADRDVATLRRVLMLLYSTPSELEEYLHVAEEHGITEVAVAPWVPGRDPAEMLVEIAEIGGLQKIEAMPVAGSPGRTHDFR